ncbi:hypothetical protein CR513_26844, partial [Mucuna pruriens]
CMTRSSSNNLHVFNLEINRTLHRLRKVRSTEVGDNSSFISIIDSVNNTFTSNPTNNFDFSEFSSADINFESNIVVNMSHELDPVENNDRAVKELATHDMLYQPWCIQYPLIHLLPKFHGLVGEDPHNHLKEFHVVCSTMRPHGIPKDYIKMKAFPFFLDGTAKVCYTYSRFSSIPGDMKQMFLEKFFPSSRIATIQKEICGLMMMDRNTIDAASGGALMDKTPTAMRHLISNMVSNTQ